MKYKTAKEWREAAMQRTSGISDAEMANRKAVAQKHILKEGGQDCGDIWEDYMLYVMGKMELGEYQSYLLFKYSNIGG